MRRPAVTLGIAFALVVAGVAIGASTGLTTQQARTAAPSAVDGTTATAEGSSLSFARADHQHGPSKTLLPDADVTRDLGSATLTWRDVYADAIKDRSGTYVLNSRAASGANFLANATDGARFDFGAGASDYASSDGTTVTFAGPIATADALTTGNGITDNGGGIVTVGTITWDRDGSGAILGLGGTIDTGGGAIATGGGAITAGDVSGGTITAATKVVVSNTIGGGTKALSGGTGTVGVFVGARCVCTDTTANASVKCVVAAGNLTITGTGTDTISYFCF